MPRNNIAYSQEIVKASIYSALKRTPARMSCIARGIAASCGNLRRKSTPRSRRAAMQHALNAVTDTSRKIVGRGHPGPDVR